MGTETSQECIDLKYIHTRGYVQIQKYVLVENIHTRKQIYRRIYKNIRIQYTKQE